MKKVIVSLMAAASFSVSAADWKGVALTNMSQIDEIHEVGANSFAYHAQDPQEVSDVLDINAGRYEVFIMANTLFKNDATGLYELKNVSEIKQAVGDRNIVFLLDEWQWNIRLECNNGKQPACDEVAAGYVNTSEVVRQIKHTFPYQIVQIMAYAEMLLQFQAGYDKVILFHAADVVGFDCYGEFENCAGYPILQYGIWIFEAMKPHQKMMLIPGTFSFAPEAVVIDHVQKYLDLYEEFKYIMRGMGAFIWGDFYENGMNYKGLKNMPNVKAVLQQRFGGLN